MGIIKAAVFDIAGVTHGLPELNKFSQDFLANGEQYIVDVVEKGKSKTVPLGVLEQVRRKVLASNNSQLVNRVNEEVDNKNLDHSFMSLMGAVNAEGLAKGRYNVCVFPDIPDALLRFKRYFSLANASNENQGGRGVYTFSNGSRILQEEMFRNATLEGNKERLNLHRQVDGYFSTAGGFDNEGPASKIDSKSFSRLAGYLGLRPTEIFFFSDSRKELEAANKAGFYVSFVNRPGNGPVDGFIVTNSFKEIEFH